MIDGLDLSINSIKTGSASLSVSQVKPRFTPNIDEMNFVLKYDNKDYLIPLTKPDLLWKHEKFNPNWPLVLLATGWTTNYNDSIIGNSALDTLYKAYHCRGNINFVVSIVCIDSNENTIYSISCCSFHYRPSTAPHTLTLCTHGLHSTPTQSARKSPKRSRSSSERIQLKTFI